MTNPRLLVSLALAAAAAPTAAMSFQSGDDGFTTGPVSGGASVPRSQPGADDIAAPVEGDDIRVNQVTTSMQNETSLAVNPLDPLNMVAAANDYQFGAVQTGWYTTTDGGKTWTTGTFGIAAGFSFSGDPCVAFDTQGVVNVVCMMYDGPSGVDQVTSFRSLDGGLTWQPPFSLGSVAGFDKPQIEADLSATSPNVDHLLVAWDQFGAAFAVDNIIVSVSADQGASWSQPQVINDASFTTISPDVAWGPNGEAYVMWADRGLRDVMFDRSLDNGVTWANDVKAADFEHVPDILPGSFFRVFDIFAMHADQSSGPHGGNIYIAYHTWADGAGDHRADVMVTTSADRGSSWSQPVKITSDVGQNDQLFPGVVVDPQGGVNVAFYDQRMSPQDNLLHTWMARSLDGGATWTDRTISDQGWSESITENPGFIGDYIDNEATTNGLLYPFWCDGRTGTQDVYTDAVNMQLFTDVDQVSASSGGVVTLSVEIGPNHGGEAYAVVASGSGTTPGVALAGGLHLPLNPDVWTEVTLAFANTPLFPGFRGNLSATGTATARMDTLGPFDPFLVGTELDFVAVAMDGGFVPTHVTSPTRVSLVP